MITWYAPIDYKHSHIKKELAMTRDLECAFAEAITENIADELLSERNVTGQHLCVCVQKQTCRVYFLVCVSTSNMETTFSLAAARNCPVLGWKRI
jgi:hypothetical protein